MAKQFFTNKGGNTLIKEFEGLLEHNTSIKHLDSVVGFLRASGYFPLSQFLDKINKVRILIGIDVDKYIANAQNKSQIFFGAADEVKQDYLARLRTDIESSTYSSDVEKGIFQLIQDLVEGKLELRAHPSKRIHAKIYLLYPEQYNQYTFGAAITGSSNLSGNGLGISNDRQYEFNVRLTDYEDVQFAKDEFEALWAEAEGCPITAEDIQNGPIVQTYLNGDVTPYELYIKMLMQFFSDQVLATDSQDAFDMPEGYDKYEYQTDAVVEGYNKLLKYDGFFLADVVGLGKTVIATMIAKQFCINNGYENTKILVVFPPAVEHNWKQTFKDFGLDKYTCFVTNGSLSKVLDVDNLDYWNADEYDLVLVDEAHKFRNHTTTAFSELQEICKMPRRATGKIPGPKKKVMLISATPMNNSPEDLYTEIQLFQDPRRCTIDGVPNLTTFFSPLIHEYKSLKREFNKNGLPQFKELAERVRDRVIKPITVRRTRTDIEAIPRYNKDIQGFPKVAPPEKKCYEMSNRIADLFEKSMISLVEELTYARYQAIAYLKPEKAEGLYDNAELVSRSLASIRKNGLVKRLESSFCAFKKSVERFRNANQYMINMFVNNRVFIAPDLDINHLYELGLNDDEIEERIQLKAESNPKNAAFTADDFDPEFITMLHNDQRVLERMCAEWETVDVEGNDDSKFATFNDILKHELFKKERNPGQKLVVFSESVDTVEYLAKRINRDDVLVVSAANRSQLYQTIRENFDANYKKAAWKNDYNIILTTDVLAEGVNLHRSNIIINYDTPWNSTKLMQRIGRVNRIGSEGKNIYNYVFHPSRQGNEIIKLTQIALSKIQSFHSTFGEDNKIYSQEEIIERNFDKLFNEGMESAKRDLNEEILFYEELRSLYDTDRREYNRINQLSLRSRTGREARSVDGVSLSQDTLVFIKTNMRKSFFRASDESVEVLSVVEALKYFKADAQEPRTDRIQNHHDHVSKALRMFNAIKGNEAATQEQYAQQPSTPVGGQMGMAISLLNSLINLIQDSNVRQQVVQLKKIAERGVINVIPRKLQSMQRALQRGDLKRDEALSQIIDLAKQYNAYYLSSQELENEAESEAQIILSESFK